MLTLPIKKKWYDMILSGEKTEEYRELKKYYDDRLLTLFGAIWVGNELLQGEAVPEEIRKEPIQEICLRNGYSGSSPSIIVRCTLEAREGNPDWGAEPGKKYYVLVIKEKLKVVNGSSCAGTTKS